MKPTLLLFDIDGTLLTTEGAGRGAMQTAATHLFGEQFTFEGIHFSGRLDPAIFADAALRNKLDDHHLHHERFRDAYLAELERALARDAARVRSAPGIAQLLAMLRRRNGEQGDVVLGLLTGNYTLAAPIKLAAVGIDPAWFTLNAFGDEGKTRPDLVALALRKYEAQTGEPADPRRVIVIGDTPRDVECARAHHCVAFAVATGKYSVAELTDAGADVAVPDLADPTALLALIDE